MSIVVDKTVRTVIARGTEHTDALEVIRAMKARVYSEYPGCKVSFGTEIWQSPFGTESCAMPFSLYDC